MEEKQKDAKKEKEEEQEEEETEEEETGEEEKRDYDFFLTATAGFMIHLMLSLFFFHDFTHKLIISYQYLRCILSVACLDLFKSVLK